MSNEHGGGRVMRCGRVVGALVVGATAVTVGFGGWGGAAGTASAESAEVRFAESSLQVVENHGPVRVVVERIDLPVSRLLVRYRTEEVASSATTGHDYLHASGTLVFDVGVRSASFTVFVRDDAVAEETEHLLLHLDTSSGTGAASRLTILDDDLAPEPDRPATGALPSAGAPAGGGAVANPAGAPVVVASSAGSSRPATVTPPRMRTRATAPARPTPRRIVLEQTPATPFELRPAPGSFGASGGPTTVDPLLALGAGLLLARVAAETWFRTRIALA